MLLRRRRADEAAEVFPAVIDGEAVVAVYYHSRAAIHHWLGNINRAREIAAEGVHWVEDIDELTEDLEGRRGGGI